jgi:hypothetical protein
MNQYFDHTTKAGMFLGTLLTLWGMLDGNDLLKTAILAGIGALVSFVVTHLLKYILNKFRK